MICNVFIKEEINSHSQKTPRGIHRETTTPRQFVCARAVDFPSARRFIMRIQIITYNLIQFAAEFFVYSLLTTSELFRCWERSGDIGLERTHYLHIFGFSTLIKWHAIKCVRLWPHSSKSVPKNSALQSNLILKISDYFWNATLLWETYNQNICV
jgi:hypothetical protein